MERRWRRQRSSQPPHTVETESVLGTNPGLGAEQDVEKVLRHERIRSYVGQLMGSAERLLPASLNKSLNLVSGREVVLEAKVIQSGEPLHEQIIFASGVQIVAVYPFNHLGGSVPYWLPVNAAAFRWQRSAGYLLIHGPIGQTTAATSTGGQPSFLTDGVHVKVCSVGFATDGLVDLALSILDFFLAGRGLQWRVVHRRPLGVQHKGREQARDR